MNTFITILNLIGLIIATVIRLILLPFDVEIISNIVFSFVTLFTMFFISRTLIDLLTTQKEKLLFATMQAQKAKAEALQSSKAKSEFLTNMSHEIRTPLNAIIGMNEMILRKNKDPEIYNYASNINLSSNVLLTIINDILDLSKIEAGKTDIKQIRYELGSLISDSYNVVAAKWAAKGLEEIIECDPSLPKVLLGDEYHLRQIIVNLLNNSIKYTNEGFISFKISGDVKDDLLNLRIEIKDSGVGISKNDLPTLFDKYHRIYIGDRQEIEGTGLGLPISKQLVELMHGTINVDSTLGVGTTFVISIPQKIIDATAIGNVKTAYLTSHRQMDDYHQSFEAPNASILVVDDLPMNLQVISKLLEDTKINIDTACSGYDCINKASLKRYDLILMDYMMPQMNGIETLQTLNKLETSLNRNVPVIMLTANAMAGTRELCLANGFVDYLTKPIRGKMLERAVMKYLPDEKLTYKDSFHNVEEKLPVDIAEELKKSLVELDFETGLSYCASDRNFYISMLLEYASTSKDELLQEAYKSNNWNDYRIIAHTLKSSSKMIGLSLLSNEFFNLETAAKNNEISYINNNHQSVLNHYLNVIDILKKTLN